MRQEAHGHGGAVLVVSSAAEVSNSIGDALEEAGFRVMACPGPSAPDYSCVGGRSGRCPLAAVADIVVLDGILTTDDVMQGPQSDELLSLYLSAGCSVVRLVHPWQGGAAFQQAVEPSGELLKIGNLIRSHLDARSGIARVELFEGTTHP